MNKQPLTAEQSAALHKAQQLFENWRDNKTGRPRIPDNLWQVATDLYHTQGMTINKIARGLRLNHTALKEKICDRIHPAKIDPPADDESTLFIEVPPPPECSDCVIEKVLTAWPVYAARSCKQIHFQDTCSYLSTEGERPSKFYAMTVRGSGCAKTVVQRPFQLGPKRGQSHSKPPGDRELLCAIQSPFKMDALEF